MHIVGKPYNGGEHSEGRCETDVSLTKSNRDLRPNESIKNKAGIAKTLQISIQPLGLP